MILGLPSTVVLAALSVAVGLLLLSWSLLAKPGVGRERTIANLQRGLQDRPITENASTAKGFARLARRLFPRAGMALLDRLHARAGRPASWPMERLVVVKVILLAVGLFVAYALFSRTPEARSVLVGLAAVAFLWFLPDLLLHNTGIKRRQAMELKLPDAMDQLSIAVEAGLGFESALNHVARHSGGPLADELVRTLQDMQVGVPRREAYLDLAERAGVPDLRRFLRSVVQAEQQGISVARVLQAQAAEMRVKRRQRAEEKAMKIPVKVVFPLMVCILPALLIVVAGPAVLNMIEAFTGGMFAR